MAKTKTAGRVHQGTPRKGKRLGIKLFEGERVKTGQIILKQRGSSFHPGHGTSMGNDFTIFSLIEGKVNYRTLKNKKIVEVI